MKDLNSSEKSYKLEIDPRILELLGPNLYTNIYYVLAELIANAYDADANNVYIISTDNSIRVEDDGHGMSYQSGEVTNYLKVAAVSRESDDESSTRSGGRKKMGRKGVGKLAALSVSQEVDVLTVADGEKSGFVLSRTPNEDHELAAIPDGDIAFDYVEEHGSAIVMRNPEYSLHKTINAIKRNLLKIFPLVDANFRIHVIRGSEQVVIDDFDRNVMGELSTLITLGNEFAELCDLVPDSHPERRSELVSAKSPTRIPIRMKNKEGTEHDYVVEIVGWIGTYKSTKGRKAEVTDFPDNFISLYANQKLGEFNILPIVGQNKLAEVYVVGQLHVDILELTELPDIALSNRQGYKTDDDRYIAVRDYVRSGLLPEILSRRELYADLENAEKGERKRKQQLADEAKLKKEVDDFRDKTSEDVADALRKIDPNISRKAVEDAIRMAIDQNSSGLGIKSLVDSQKKKILISQTEADKEFSDVIYELLLHNEVPAEEILYTACDHQESRIPLNQKVYEYLREFFVQSYSNQMIYVLFVTSNNTKGSWGAVTEVGASWITQADHQIFSIAPFAPQDPLDVRKTWQTTKRDADTNELSMDRRNADILCEKIEAVCDFLGYTKKPRGNNMAYLESLVTIN